MSKLAHPTGGAEEPPFPDSLSVPLCTRERDRGAQTAPKKKLCLSISEVRCGRDHTKDHHLFRLDVLLHQADSDLKQSCKTDNPGVNKCSMALACSTPGSCPKFTILELA